jgi:hypothetical protein
MRLAALAATASIAVLAFGATACKSSSHASAPAAATNAPATETQADATQSPSTGASTAASTASSSASPSASASAAASAAASAPAAAAGGEINACSLLTGAQASSLTGRSYGTGTASTIAPGQDQCDYPYSGAGIDLTVIVYQPSSGVSWNVMTSVLSGVGTVQQVAGVGDKAMFAGIELDVATGKWLFSVQGADALNADTGSIAVAKEIVGALASK